MSKDNLVVAMLAVLVVAFALLGFVPRRLRTWHIEQALNEAWTTFDQAAAARDQPSRQYALIKLLVSKSDAVTAAMSGGSYADWKRLNASAQNLGRCQTTLITYRNVFIDPTFNDAMRTRMTNYLSSCVENHELNY
jgi:hypothetical protein